MSAAALRNLFDHNVSRLDAKWRDLPESAWSAEVQTAQGRIVSASETVWMRAREVWIHAVDLGSGARFADFPDLVLESLLTDIVRHWQSKRLGDDLLLEVAGAVPLPIGTEGQDGVCTIRGLLAGVVRWSAGRGAIGVESSGGVLSAPPWL